MLGKVRAISCDIDGTLMCDGGVDLRLLEQLAAHGERGTTIIIVSGRSMPKIVNLSWLESCGPKWIVSAGGASIWRYPSRRRVQWNSIHTDFAAEIIRRHSAGMQILYDDERAPVSLLTTQHARASVVAGRRSPAYVGDYCPAAHVPTLRCVHSEEWIEIQSARATKSQGIGYVLAEEHLTFEDMVACGDDHTDAGTLRMAAIGVAVGAAATSAITAADLHVPDWRGMRDVLESI